MDNEVKKSLEESGWKVGDVQDFLQLTDKEVKEVDFRVAKARILKHITDNGPALVEKWSKNGLLDKVPTKYKMCVAFMLENQEMWYAKSKAN